MQVYSKTDLHNKYLQEEASEAFVNKWISSESYKKILQAYPCKLYTPNYFIRIALGVLTLIASVCSGLLLWLLTGTSSSNGLTGLFIFLAISCYIALEFFSKAKQFYNAGVDNMLMIQVTVFIVSAAFAADFQTSYLFISSIIMVSCLWLSLRFSDAFMAVIAYIALFVFVFLLYVKLGDIGKATAPFVMMAVSAAVYFIAEKLVKRKIFIYLFSLKAVKLLTLLTFYASGNYFIVKELGNSMFHLSTNEALPLGMIFWIFTIVIPPAYITYGIIKKDFLFMRAGLGLIAATIFTIRYYHAILPAEAAMLIGGAILLAVSYVLIKFLKTPKYGFSFEKANSDKNLLNIEAMVIAQTFGQKQPASESSPLYGGGSGGGGGATGDY